MEQLPVEYHGVRFFERRAYPAERVAAFLKAGLDQGSFVMALAKADHLEALSRSLAALGVDCEERSRAGQLVLEDAGATAQALIQYGRAEKSGFDALIAAPLQRGIERHGRARAYGEVVDELMCLGDPESCTLLEGFWSELCAMRPIELWCGYTLEHFEAQGSSSVFREVCNAHQYVECDAAELAPGRMAAELWRSRAALIHEAAHRRSVERDLAHAYEDLKRAYEATRSACERAEQVDRTKDEFMSRLGHELRNPLSPILVASELMARRDPETFAPERKVIERQARHLMRLIDDLQDVGRVTSGRVELTRRPVELGSVVSAAVEVAQPLIVQRGHELSVDVPASGLLVDGDHDRLAQVVANLLINAAKYTPDRGRIDVVASSSDERAKLAVRDDGAGLEPEFCSRVFEPFVQGPQSRARTQGGLGLGLSIARSLVELHGGKLQAKSDGPGCGSTFELELPLASARTALLAEQQRRTRTSRPLDVLVIDDNGDLASLFAESLRECGHRVEVALDGGAALRIAADFRPDIALLDLGLPDIDGCELGVRLKAQLAEHELKLVAISGYGQDADRQRTRAAGFDLHLVKPVPLAQLEIALAALFAESRVA